MSTPQFGQPGYDPAHLTAAADQVRGGPAPQSAWPSDEDLAAQLRAQQAGAPAGLTDMDVSALLAGIKALQDRVDALEAEKSSGAGLPVVNTAQALRDLIATHAAHTPGTDHADLLRLADDAVDAAGNAASSGDGGPLTDISGKIARALQRANPGPGTHHSYQQAVGFAEVHLPDAAAQLVPKSRAVAAVGSDRPPAPVIQGSVTASSTAPAPAGSGGEFHGGGLFVRNS